MTNREYVQCMQYVQYIKYVQYIQYVLYIQYVQCTGCMMYTVYGVYSMYNVKYTVCKVCTYSVQYAVCTVYSTVHAIKYPHFLHTHTCTYSPYIHYKSFQALYFNSFSSDYFVKRAH